MSYTDFSHLTELVNKKVLFFDLETSGLPINKGYKELVENRYYPYTSNDKYDSSRIVQIGWLFMKDFDYDYEITLDNISELIVKPDGFVIPDNVIAIHKITNEFAKTNGKTINQALKNFSKHIEKSDYIIGYNIYFDIYILLNEFARLNMNKPINKILDLIKNKKILCVQELSKKYKGFTPKQVNMYEELFGKPLVDAHNAKSDILATINILTWYKENINVCISKKRKIEQI